MPNALTQDQPPDCRLPSKVDSAEPNHSLDYIPATIVATVRTMHLCSQAWRALTLILRLEEDCCKEPWKTWHFIWSVCYRKLFPSMRKIWINIERCGKMQLWRKSMKAAFHIVSQHSFEKAVDWNSNMLCILNTVTASNLSAVKNFKSNFPPSHALGHYM
jgi:hypothetical protein